MALRELLTLNEGVRQIQAAQSGDVYHAPRPVHFSDGTQALPSITFASDPDTGIRWGSSGRILFPMNGTDKFDISTSRAALSNTQSFGWTATTAASGTLDTILERDAANTLALRNGTNAQTFNLYNTFTDASNYERGVLKWDTNILEVGSEAAGTGTARSVALVTGGSQRLTVDSSGNVGVGVSPTSAKLTLAQGGAQTGLLFDQNGNGSAIVVDSESTSVNVFDFLNPQTTTGKLMNVSDADALTTGRIFSYQSNSASASTRQLGFIQNVNSAATGTDVLNLRQEAANQVLVLDQRAVSSFVDYQGTINGTAIGPITSLTTSGATTNHVLFEINGTPFWIAGSTTAPT